MRHGQSPIKILLKNMTIESVGKMTGRLKDAKPAFGLAEEVPQSCCHTKKARVRPWGELGCCSIVLVLDFLTDAGVSALIKRKL